MLSNDALEDWGRTRAVIMAIIDEERPDYTLPERREEVFITQQRGLLQLCRDQVEQVHCDEARYVLWRLSSEVGAQWYEVSGPDVRAQFSWSSEEHFNRCSEILNRVPGGRSPVPIWWKGLVEEERSDISCEANVDLWLHLGCIIMGY